MGTAPGRERRKLRPDHEYRDVTRDAWDEFEEHFDKRKVELGVCRRPYGTPCQHEHVPLTVLDHRLLPHTPTAQRVWYRSPIDYEHDHRANPALELAA
ncbi:MULTISPECIES: hypothetical protein [unclassified Streptomyces]|uniref:hypothetical protein n=1 Tax=unclassified Streptomyces TaxID=2593676 RepID=UPI0022519A19|nr:MULTISPECIES: hypothetical protein [unclassified Streptomyces]MCX4792894.1 hypothetical protein [Streptomyces sp. NBC_01242]WSP60392.1 hypothetical protein OG306_38580 [Streptomyces sp. NBC_01241]WSP67672.1 hypothetical protein OG466_01855 [Streptomyces sp. NBC_01240]WSU26743.1 hypothetical protein OG508_01780 [Streptomyces sp. NBC_01108]